MGLVRVVVLFEGMELGLVELVVLLEFVVAPPQCYVLYAFSSLFVECWLV